MNKKKKEYRKWLEDKGIYKPDTINQYVFRINDFLVFSEGEKPSIVICAVYLSQVDKKFLKQYRSILGSYLRFLGEYEMAEELKTMEMKK